MLHTDTSKSQATNRISYHASQISANHRRRIIHLPMPHTDTSKSQAILQTNRTSCHASHRYQQITGHLANKSYILPCLTQTPANHRQQIVHLTMPHTDTSKSHSTSRKSCHASHRYQQITGNKSYILPCLTQTPADHRQRIVHLTMPHTDTSKSQATNRTSCHASHRYQQITGNKLYILPCLTQIPAKQRQQIVHLTMPHTDTSKSQATNRTSYNASHRYHQITGNKSDILPCVAQIPANHRQQVVHLTALHTDTCKSQATNRTSYHASHRCQQITGNKSYIVPCVAQIPANHRQQIGHLTMPHTDTSKSQETKRISCHAQHRYQEITGNTMYILPCFTQIPANHRQQIRCQQITDNKSYIVPCVAHMPANHRQQIVHLTMPPTDTSKSQATNRTSCHASHRYQQITGNKSYFLSCL